MSGRRLDSRSSTTLNLSRSLIQRDDLVAEIQDEMRANSRTNKSSSARHNNTHRLETPLMIAEGFFNFVEGGGLARSLSVKVKSAEASGQSMPRSGSSHASPRSRSVAQESVNL
jgi:hypothetical protein